MMLTPSMLKEIGRALHGERWGEPTARDMGVSPQMMVRYRKHGANPRRTTREKLADACRARAALLLRFAEELLS